MKIQLDNFFLRPLEAKDEKDIYENISEEVTKWLPKFPKPYSENHAKEYINTSIKNFNNGEAYDFGIVFEGKVIGTISLFEINKKKSSARIAYLLNKNYWGKKIIGKAVPKIIDFGFNNLGLKLIYTGVIPENKASEKILIKNNFLKKSTNKDEFLIDGKYYSEVIYELSRAKI